MEVLIRRYYERLPKEISKLAETKIVFGWLSRCPVSDIYTLISDLASDNDAAFQSWLLSKKENDDIKDFRVRKLFLRHFRKFDDLNGKSFLLNCEDKNKVCSLFVTGKNGSGKTSIFTAMERLFTPGHTSTILQRHITDTSHFYSYGNRPDTDISVKAILADGYELDHSLESELSLIPFFCSDMDLQNIQSQNDLQSVLTEQLGLDEIDDLLNSLKKATDDLRKDANETDEVRLLTDAASDMLPADIFYLGGQNNPRYSKILRAWGILAHNDSLNKIYTDKRIRSVDDKDQLMADIKEVVRLFNLSKELNSSVFYQAYNAKLKNYEKILDLLTDNQYFEADELYQKSMPIETFAKDVSEFAYFLSRTFQDKNLERNAEKRRKVALDAIIDYDRQRLDRERKKLLKKNSDLLKKYPTRIENLQKLYSCLKDLYVEDKQRLLDASRVLIVQLLNEFTKLDRTNDKNECLDIISEHGKMVAVVRNDKIFGVDGYSTPAKYYNSFRYKLYCISIKVVMAYMTMKLNKINAPLIFDDVFTASDFDNTVNITRFFEVLFQVFEEAELGKKKDLQIILFTHDEVVMNSLSDIIDTLEDENDEVVDISYITGILLDPKVIDERDYQKADDAYLLYSRIN